MQEFTTDCWWCCNWRPVPYILAWSADDSAQVKRIVYWLLLRVVKMPGSKEPESEDFSIMGAGGRTLDWKSKFLVLLGKSCMHGTAGSCTAKPHRYCRPSSVRSGSKWNPKKWLWELWKEKYRARDQLRICSKWCWRQTYAVSHICLRFILWKKIK